MLKMSIIIQAQKCPNCGGPLPGTQNPVVVCSYCEAQLARPPLPAYRIPSPLPTLEVPDVGLMRVGSLAYRVLGRLAQGVHSDVFLARRDSPLTEMVLIKVARHDPGPLGREWQRVKDLRARESRLLLPEPVAVGVARSDHRPERQAAVFRWRSGFQFTFEDARAEYPAGVDPAATVWMWNRLLEQLALLHGLGYCHGAVEPQHLLLHPRDHGLMLCGWSACQPGGGQADVAASGRCIEFLLGSTAPRLLSQLARQAAKDCDAFQLKAELKRVTREVFGPPRFVPFHLTQNNGGQYGIR